MRKVLIALAATAALATPALANEVTVEARSGINWISGGAAAVSSVGVAGTYDAEVGSNVFVGAELSADKLLESGSHVLFGLSARLGTKVTENGKLYAVGGYETSFHTAEHDWNLGAGYQHSFGKVYVKAEYRRSFDDEINTVLTGVGYKF